MSDQEMAQHGVIPAIAPLPVAETGRIASLDVLRGFALLGILLLNILGFGLHSAGYFNPWIGSGETELSQIVNLSVWASVDVLFEGAMRCLFSILFGAGVVLFTTGAGAKSGALHYKRNVWLLLFGVVDAYVLLWSGDILITYALAGMLLYPFRDSSPRRLIVSAFVLVALMSLMYGAMNFGLSIAREAAEAEASATGPASTQNARVATEAWNGFIVDYAPDDAAYEQELEDRRGSYASAFAFTAVHMTELLVFVVPVLLVWDSLAMMLLGMGLFKLAVLDSSRTVGFYVRLTVAGFAVGILTNWYELYRVFTSGFDPLAVHGYMRPSYHIGRLGMAAGYLGFVMLACKLDWWAGLRAQLAAVGRMALTNYLGHSLICLFLFTGAGLALVGELERWQLYLVVFALWALQLWFSPWWLNRYKFGPVEWLWRALTYGKAPGFVR
jgi:uncharacterized protein